MWSGQKQPHPPLIELHHVGKKEGMDTHLGNVSKERLRSFVLRTQKDADEGFGLVETSLDGVNVALWRSTLSRRAQKSARCGINVSSIKLG